MKQCGPLTFSPESSLLLGDVCHENRLGPSGFNDGCKFNSSSVDCFFILKVRNN